MNISESSDITLARKRDALALAQLILDIYKRKKQEDTLLVNEEVDNENR